MLLHLRVPEKLGTDLKKLAEMYGMPINVLAMELLKVDGLQWSKMVRVAEHLAVQRREHARAVGLARTLRYQAKQKARALAEQSGDGQEPRADRQSSDAEGTGDGQGAT